MEISFESGEKKETSNAPLLKRTVRRGNAKHGNTWIKCYATMKKH